MKDTNNYPNYIGCEAEVINSISITLKYTGEEERHVIVSDGMLVCIGRVLNNNGVLSYGIVMGVVKKIGATSVRGSNSQPANPFYLVIDKSNTYTSDIETIYLRDIRDIIVGPMAEGNFAKGNSSGTELPLLNKINKDLYEGRFFYLTEDDLFGTMSDKGLYYALDGHWIGVTTLDNTWTSPLVASFGEIDIHRTGAISGYTLRGDVFMRGTNLCNIPLVKDNVFDGIVCDTENSDIRIWVNGDVVTYQLHLVGLKLPVEPLPEVPPVTDTPGFTEICTVDSYKGIICKPGYWQTEDENNELERSFPEHNTPVNTNRVKIGEDFYNVYHRVNTEGNIVICYPNIEGITEMDLGGFYLRK